MFIQEVNHVRCQMFYHAIKEALITTLKHGYDHTQIQDEIRLLVLHIYESC